MTMEEVVRAAEICSKRRSAECRHSECPLFSTDYCTQKLLGHAVTYLSMYQRRNPARDATPLKDSAPNNPGHILIGEIMSHYKKPFVTIAINISEDNE